MKIEFPAEGRYLLAFDSRELARYTCDVLVMGSGIAGMSAALAAAEEGARVLMVLKDPPEQANTAWAQGGIAAAIEENSGVEAHIEDTMRVGGSLCDPEVVRSVATEGPAAIRRLVDLGTRFDRDAKGRFALGREAGHGIPRVLHARGDATGVEVVRSLVEATGRHPGIHVLNRIYVIDLLTADGRCVGALARRRRGELVTILARSVIVASGGVGRLFRETSNVRGATGDGIAAAFRAGAAVRDMEFVQFHPTTLYLAGSERTLITEAVRGDGARIIDNRGRRFVADAHPSGELAPRDVVSRAILEHLSRPEVTDVYLDMRHWPAGHAKQRFPGLVRICAHYDLDPEKDPIPVRPAAHYFIGGIAADLDGRSDLDGLFACGEAACTGLHGANRLASNSLLEGLVLGHRAGRAAAAGGQEHVHRDISHRDARTADPALVDAEDLRKSLVSRMWRCTGILRDAAGLADATDAIERWRIFLSRVRLFGRAGFELENLLLLGNLVSTSATLRRESRGTHQRRDFPATDDSGFRGSFHWSRDADVTFRRLEPTPRG